MAFPLTTGTPSHGGSHPSPAWAGTFIPELWWPRALMKFYATTVLRNIVNFDYEAAIRQYGDTIKIRTVPTVTVRPYSADDQLVTDRFGAPVVTMLIDKGIYVQTVIDDVYRAQTDMDFMSMISDAIANEMRIAVEQDVFAGIVGSISPDNIGPTAGFYSDNINLGTTGAPLKVTLNPSAANDVDPLRLLLRLNQVLSEQRLPPDGRWWAVIPPWFAQLLKPGDLKSAADMGDRRSVLRTGEIGRIDNMSIYVSNLLPISVESGTNVSRIYAGHPAAISFATQLTVTEDFRSQISFGTGLRSLQVYGYKVVQPTALASAYAYGLV